MKPNPFPSAKILEGGYPESRALWIGNGPSAALVAEKPLEWFGRYDFIMLSNGGYEMFAEHPVRMRWKQKPDWYWLCVESTGYEFDWFDSVPQGFNHIVLYTNITHNKRRLPLHWTPLNTFTFGLNYKMQRFYPLAYNKGLLSGKKDEYRLNAGTVTLQAMHLACLMGARRLDMIGVEMCAVDGRWHFYEDTDTALKRYADWSRKLFQHVDCEGQKCLSHRHFIQSAPFIDRMYGRFKAAGMECVRYCPSLIQAIPREELPA